MGGNGSGRHSSYDTKRTVEDCLVLNVERLVRIGMIGPRSWFGVLNWTRTSTGEKTASAGYQCVEEHSKRVVRLNYTATHSDGVKRQADQRIVLQTTRMPSGGARWWFTCPLIVKGLACRRRVGKLYLPPGSLYFGCRHCHDLTYTSCQESHKYDRLYRTIASDVGCSPEMVKGFFREKW